MNFQEKLLEASSDLRARAAAMDVDGLKASFATLAVAARRFNQVAQRHAVRFVKENSALAKAAGKDVGTLARSTYASLAHPKAPAKARKPRTAGARKRAAAKAR